MFEQGDFFPFLAVFASIITVPYLVLVSSAFVKIAVVIMILRNALGIQQTPPNIVVYTIALALTIFIMQPVAQESFFNTIALDLEFKEVTDFLSAGEAAIAPLKEFLMANARPEDVAFFQEVRASLWDDGTGSTAFDTDTTGLTLLTPAFMLSELTRAFEMGFMLYLPFLAVDLVLTALLMAMGMSMVSPTVVAVPFKLLLFVALDGWPKLIQGLVLSYA